MLREQERPAFGGWLISDSKRAKITTIRSAVIREVINSKNKGLPAAGRQPAALIHTHDVVVPRTGQCNACHRAAPRTPRYGLNVLINSLSPLSRTTWKTVPVF